jgi:hypothetical protein
VRIPKFDAVGVLAPLKDWVLRVEQILTNGWTIRDQAAGEVKTFRWDGIGPLSLSTTLRARPAAVFLLEMHARAAPEVSYSGPIVTWSWEGDTTSPQVVISGIGEPAAGDFDATVWIVGG